MLGTRLLDLSDADNELAWFEANRLAVELGPDGTVRRKYALLDEVVTKGADGRPELCRVCPECPSAWRPGR